MTCTRSRVRCRWRKKRCPRPLPRWRAGDQAGDLRQNQGLPVIRRDQDPQLRGQGGERKDVHPGLGGGEGLEQRGLAGVGGAHQADVGQDLQLQVDLAFLARFPGLGEAGGAHPGGGEMGVAFAAAAAFGHHQALAGGDQVARSAGRRRRRPGSPGGPE